MTTLEITSQHTYTFPITGESVTVFISNTVVGFAVALSVNHKTPSEELKWNHCYESILQIQSTVNPKIWYMYLNAYWESRNSIPTERVMMVCDCNFTHHG